MTGGPSTSRESSNPGNLPSAITSLATAVCRVCGTRLTPPLVACPRCEAPHHSDCWEYNGGCSTYGCREHVPATVVVEDLPPTQTVSGADLFFEAWDPRTNPALAAVLVLVLLRLTPAPWDGVFLGGALLSFLVIQVRRTLLGQNPAQLFAAEPETTLAIAERDADSTALEAKAVTVLLGAGLPHALAQTYALFEQRHPRRALEGAAQAALAHELAANGYRVLALEALDKADQITPVEPPLEVSRDALLADEPAYAVVPAAEDTGNVLPFQKARFRLASLRSRSALPASQLGLASLSPSGWPWEIRSELLAPGTQTAGTLGTPQTAGTLGTPQTAGTLGTPQTPGQRDTAALPDRGWLLAGPFDAERVRELLTRLWDRGHPSVAVTEQELALDSTPEPVSSTHLSQEEGRFQVGAIEVAVPWSQVTDVFYGMVVQEAKILDRPDAPFVPSRFSASVMQAQPQPELTTYRPVIELHFGEERRRLRISEPGPEIFRYLGRRLRYIEAENVRLVAKDLVRFAPHARASHGMLGLMMERPIPGARFEGEPQFEEYVRWFVTLGRPGVRQRLTASVSG